MTEKPNWQYKGWFLFAPVYINDPEGECMIGARWGLEWVFDFAQAVCGSITWVLSAIDPEYEPMFQIKITGRVK